MAKRGTWSLDNLLEQVKAVCEISDEGCWFWRFGVWAERGLVDRGEHGPRSYPRLMIDGERKTAARWVLIASGYPEPPGMEPCHSCDRPPCIAPHHLRWDTHKANMQEMGQRGRSGPQRHPESRQWGENHKFRQHPDLIPRGPRTGNFASGDDHWTRRDPDSLPWLGTAHHQARLTPDRVREIRALKASGLGATAIARGLGVGTSTVQAVLEGRTWKHVA